MADDYFAQFGGKPDPATPDEGVRDIHADVSVERIAAVYAQGLLDMAEAAGRAAELVEEFDSFVDDVLHPSPAFERVLASGLISHEEKSRLLDGVLAKHASREFMNFLKVVSRHGRLDLLRDIRRETRELYERRRGEVRVVVITAAPVDGALAARIADRVRPLLDGEPVLEQVVDPGIIGGIVIRVGDTVYDASVANQLKNLRQQMIDRSAYEIQSRRDRFRYPAGN